MKISKLIYENKLVKNKRGSILALVVMIGACLFILASALMINVASANKQIEMVNNSENAYLVAKSGLQLMLDAGKDSNFAEKMMASVDKPDPMVMDFGNVGKCEVKLISAGDDTDPNGIPIKIIKAECRGIHNGSEFLLKRFFTLKQTGVTKKSDLRTCAYIHYGDGDMYIQGGIEGDAIIMGNGKLDNFSSTGNTPMHSVVVYNSLKLVNSQCTYDLVATGSRLALAGSAYVKTDVYVGANERDADNKDTGVLKDNIAGIIDISTIGGTFRCEGVTVLGNSAQINYNNLENPNFGSDDRPGLVSDPVVKDSSKVAIYSGGDVYIGYTANNYDSYYTGDSYKNPSSSVNTATGLSVNNSGLGVYGSIVSGGDVKIGASGNICGDIICKGDLIVESNCKIYGKMYVGGNVIIKGNSGVGGMFPNGDNRVIYAGGTIDMQNPNISKDDFICYENQTTIPKHGVYFNGSDFVGAAAYFKDNYESAPKPTTKIPESVLNAPIKQISETVTRPKTYICYHCTEPMYQERDMEEWCTWCDDRTYWAQVDQWNFSHVNHKGKAKHVVHDKPVDPPQMETIVNNPEKTLIDQSKVRLVGDINLGSDDNSQQFKLYINCAAVNGGTGGNIDILLDGTINIGNNGGIYINDNGGQNQVRLFMKKGSRINFNSGWGGKCRGIYVISDDAKDIDIEALPSNAISPVIDMEKVPQFYMFGEEGESDIQINLGNYGWIPGYVLMPYVDVAQGSNAHGYDEGKPIEENHYPLVNGMLMCNALNFPTAKSTWIKYDWYLDDEIDRNNSEVMVKSEKRKKFDAALARDNVMLFSGGNNIVGNEGSADTVTWVVTGTY